MKKLGLLFSAAVAAIALGAAPASAGGYPPGEDANLLIAPSTVVGGATFAVSLVGCSIGETVNFSVEGSTASAPCNGPAGATDAVANAELTAPTAPGTYSVVATGATSGITDTATLTVVAGGGDDGDDVGDDDDGTGGDGTGGGGTGGTGGGQLPATGSDSMPVAQIAGGLVAAGAGLAAVAGLRRRKGNAAA